ncbi:D-tyrosyl-tRNA(Tyr) deacylase [bacterium]|nr:D-tyrosyl-tRNA(Tyr) deacylase [candidate division CSSED10-310 bacterium]
MMAVLQRVSSAAVRMAGNEVGRIGLGFLVLLGVEQGDSEADGALLARKLVNLRVFDDGQNRMNRSLLEVRGELLVVSQFTLLADTHKGRRPSFHRAAPPAVAERLYEAFNMSCRELGVPVATGVFQAMMQVDICNDGPVTLVLDSLNRRGNKPKGDEDGN